MTDKQIIIDGCDVSGCPYYCGHDICKNTCHYFSTPCEWVDVQNCTYKQLKRKEQECEEWKNLTVDNGAVALKYQKQLDKLKEELEQEKAWHKTSDEINKVNSEYTVKLRQALTKIQDLLLKTPTNSQQHCANVKSVILQKISEVENG